MRLVNNPSTRTQAAEDVPPRVRQRLALLLSDAARQLVRVPLDQLLRRGTRGNRW